MELLKRVQRPKWFDRVSDSLALPRFAPVQTTEIWRGGRDSNLEEEGES